MPSSKSKKDKVDVDAMKNVTLGKKYTQDYLNQILREIRLSKQAKKTTKEHVQNIQVQLIEEMRILDKLFAKMNPVLDITGSVQKKLKVEKPNEFDVNVLLSLPLVEQESVRVDTRENYPDSYVCSFAKKSWEWPEPRKKRRRAWRLLQSADNNDKERVCLRADGVRNWIQGLVARALRSKKKLQQAQAQIDSENKEFVDWSSISESRSGPAITLIIRLDEDEVSIDLVPVVKVPESRIPLLDEKLLQEIVGEVKPDLAFHLVPVAPRVVFEDANQVPRDLLFRGTFPTYEEALLKKKQCFKEVIRVLKDVRNANHWEPIASFYLINLCANWNREHLLDRKLSVSYSNDHLEQDQLETVFRSVLIKLEKCLKERSLPMTLIPDSNLFVKLNEEFCENCSNRVAEVNRRLSYAFVNKPEDVPCILDQLFKRKLARCLPQEEEELGNNDNVDNNLK